MTIHYHCSDINNPGVLETLAGGFFCVSFAYPRNVERTHKIAQGVMLDNGAFTIWRKGNGEVDVEMFWEWAEQWLEYPTTWAVIPDHISGDWVHNNKLISDTPKRIPAHKVAPVWHMHDPIHHLVDLVSRYPRVCIGSSGQYAELRTPAWDQRMDLVFETLHKMCRYLPMLHMMRGMSLCREGNHWPFHSLDSSDVARHHHENRHNESARDRMHRWDSHQCIGKWVTQPKHDALYPEESCS